MKLLETLEGPMWVFDASYVGHVLSTGAWWDMQIRPSIDRAAAARPGTWGIDLGANQGWFTHYLAKKFAHVIAVEACAQTFRLLQKNVALWELELKVDLYCCAAYDRVTSLVLGPAALHGWEPPKDMDTQPNGDSIGFVPPEFLEGGPYAVSPEEKRIAARPMDLYVPLGAEVGFIKCDVQGADLQALKGLKATIARCRPVIVFECEQGMLEPHGTTWEDYLNFFVKIGYEPPRQIQVGVADYEVLPLSASER